MRVDKFLNAVNIAKSRKIAGDMCDSNVVYINDTLAKSSKNIAVGSHIKIVYLDYTKVYEILILPTTRSTNKKEQHLFVKELAL